MKVATIIISIVINHQGNYKNNYSNLNIESQENYGLASNQVNSSEDNNLYNTFTRYAKGG